MDPPPPQPPLPSSSSSSSSPSSSLYLSPSIFIIAAIIAFVILASASIHLLLRCLSRRSHSHPSSSSYSSRVAHRISSSSSSSSSGDGDSAAAAAAAAAAAGAGAGISDREKEAAAALISSLPLFTLGSSLAAPPKSSPDCAVCLSPFHPDAQLRLLPSCRHAFHSHCIDPWILSSPSCPLCRSPIALPNPNNNPNSSSSSSSRSPSFRIEIGSVSRRRGSLSSSNSSSGDPHPPPPPPPPPDPNLRSYSMDSFDYVVEEEVEVVVPRIFKEEKPLPARPTSASVGPHPPGDEVAEAAGGAGRGWLRDYVDRLTSSASSSFNSLRFSGRWSQRFNDVGGATSYGGAPAPDSWLWDLEDNHLHPHPHHPARAGECEESGFSTFYRWLSGV